MTNRGNLLFVNYRGSDEYWATELVYARMTEAFGVDAVFKAGSSIHAGEVFPPILRRQAASCPVMLACIGPGWITAGEPSGTRDLDSPDDWVRQEIAISLRSGNHVIPVLMGNYNELPIPNPDVLPSDIRALFDHQAVRLVPGKGLKDTIPALIDRLAELVPELDESRTVAQPQLPRADRAAAVPNSGEKGRDAEPGLLKRTLDKGTYGNW